MKHCNPNLLFLTTFLLVLIVSAVFPFVATADDLDEKNPHLAELKEVLGELASVSVHEVSAFDAEEDYNDVEAHSYVKVHVYQETDATLAKLATASNEAHALIENLSITHAYHDPKSLRVIGKLSSLKSLRVRRVNWHRELSKVVADSTTLEVIWAEQTSVDGKDLELICRAHQLTALMIGANKYSGDDLKCLGKLTNLTQLAINRMPIESKDLTFLKKLKRLQVLWLSDTNVDDGIFPVVSNCNRLEILALPRTNCTEEGVRKAQSQLPKAIISFEPK